jgi:hypothetical protein
MMFRVTGRDDAMFRAIQSAQELLLQKSPRGPKFGGGLQQLQGLSEWPTPSVTGVVGVFSLLADSDLLS